MAEVAGEPSVSFLGAMCLYSLHQTYAETKKCAMTSEERREARYQRRVAKRRAKKATQLIHADNYDDVFSYRNLYNAYRKCRRGVAWKASVQKYITQAPLNVYKTFKELEAGKFKTPGFYEFDIFERGKARHIRSTGIQERVVQRCLCDNALVPALQRTFVYDNGASMKNKGYTFAVRRITEHLRRHYRKYGNEGYILVFDFSRFFDNVSHAIVKEMIRTELSDERIIALTYYLIDAFGTQGLGLGSQISQVLSLASANKLDHLCKEILKIKGYARYMDDGYLLHHDKATLKECLEAMKRVCEQLHITLSEKKTQIVKLSHGFTWLQIRFYLTKTGKIVRKIYKNSVTRQRRKLKKFRKRLDEGKMTFDEIIQSVASWFAYAKNFNSYYTRKNMRNLFTNLFDKEIRIHGYNIFKIAA